MKHTPQQANIMSLINRELVKWTAKNIKLSIIILCLRLANIIKDHFKRNKRDSIVSFNTNLP